MTKPAPRGEYTNRIRSLMLVSGHKSVFATVRPDRISALAQRIAGAHNYITLDDESLRNAVMNIASRDKSYFAPPNEVASNARFEQIEVSSIAGALAKMSASERLDYSASKKIPHRFCIAPKIVVKNIAAALEACTPAQRLRYQEDYILPGNIEVLNS